MSQLLNNKLRIWSRDKKGLFKKSTVYIFCINHLINYWLSVILAHLTYDLKSFLLPSHVFSSREIKKVSAFIYLVKNTDPLCIFILIVNFLSHIRPSVDVWNTNSLLILTFSVISANSYIFTKYSPIIQKFCNYEEFSQ